MYRELICEGACNPGVAQLDREVAAARLQRPAGDNGPLDDLRLIDRLGLLRHTLHLGVNETVFACVLCGWARQFGGQPFPVLSVTVPSAKNN